KTPKDKNLVYGRFLEAIHLEETAKEFEEVEISADEKKQIEALSKNPKIYELLSKSIAPNIYGHEIVKESIALQLFGGVKKLLPNDTNIRGNIHLLLVGDPGVAKSAILQAVNKIAPKSIYTAGKTSTGVGLCIAPDSLVLNDHGFKPIQEFVENNFDENHAQEEINGAYSNPFNGSAFALSNELDFVESPIEKIWRIKAPKKMVRIQTGTGRELCLTPATSLIRIKKGKIEWIAASQLQEDDFVACPRLLPEGKRKNIPVINVLEKNPNIKIADPLAGWIKEITDRLIPKYDSLQAIAQKIGKSRDTLYAVRNSKFYHGWELHTVMKLAREASFSEEEITKRIQTLFISHGKTFKIPRYLDNPKIGYLAGLALGDGNLSEKTNSSSIRIFNSDPEVLERATKISQELFGIKPEYVNDAKRVPLIRIKFKAVCDLLKEFGLQAKKSEICISHTATEMPNNVLASVLQGLFDTDGYVSNSRHGSVHVGLTTISPKLADSLQLALLKFGIIVKKRKRAKAGQIAVGKNITVTSRHDQYCIEIRGKKNLELFQDKIGFQLKRKKRTLEQLVAKIPKENTNIDVIPEIAEQLKEINAGWIYKKQKRNISNAKLKKITQKLENNHFLKKLANANIFWDPIKTKEYFKPAYSFVYDFTVKEHHNFIANGFFVHNTASAVKDDFGEGGWTLKAGALVLANGGLAIIDEFDKMETEDRSAMHEAMEQGMISVAKAGIVTRFKTDTTILAAANPKFARFDQYKNFLEQIDLPPTLISRFDLFFMIFDVLDRKKDEEISGHILRTHQAGESMLQYRLKGGKKRKEIEELEKSLAPAIKAEVLKKYISYARQNIFPVLTKEAIQTISDYYVNLREQGKKQGTYSATHRQLEGLVRLSEASARIRLSDTIETEDTDRAIRLLRTSLQELVTDKETGHLDIDLLTTGQSTSQTNQIKTILGIVQSLSQEHDKVLIEMVFDETKKQGIEKDKTRELIAKLKRTGDLYEPAHGVIKPVHKEY
ncbi:ATP-binding protein, partial [Candidatus Micrarchaeota archaeon]|nr:ATP-binding protein [Candidatus Micrarchaeota archaeon]